MVPIPYKEWPPCRGENRRSSRRSTAKWECSSVGSEQRTVNPWVVGSSPSTPAKCIGRPGSSNAYVRFGADHSTWVRVPSIHQVERSLTSLKESRAGPTVSPASIIKKEYGNG